MNLLITNTQEDQAYLILQCLRKEANKIIVTVSGSNLFKRWSGLSQWSRHVSKRYRVPDVYADWKAGRIQARNSDDEERYIQRIEEICAAEDIDTIFPSYDAEVYIFSKNKQRLAGQGIVAVVPDYNALTGILDKSLTLAAAEKSGFPIPRTAVIVNSDDLAVAHNASTGPWILKPRCNAHGANIIWVSDRDALEATFNNLNKLQPSPILQDFIPEATKRNYYLVVDRDSEIVSLFSPEVLRTRKTGVRSPCAAVVSSTDVPYLDEVRALLRELGIWGGMTLQTIVDQRDDKPKLMEINPRFGHNLWYRTVLGMNEPLMFLRIANGQDPGPAPTFREGVILLDPMWDLRHLIGQVLDQTSEFVRVTVLRRPRHRERPSMESIPQLLGDLRKEYFSKRDRVLSPLNRGFLSDPFPPMIRMFRVVAEAFQERWS
jgi:predicted ATP-grasp superfamily ATP-dependent carboligase